LSNSAVSGNRALALGQTNAVGGAIYVTSTGSLTVTGSTPGASQIDNNSSIAAAGASGSGQAGLDAYAGGIMFSAGTSLQFTGTTLANNAALGGAGGSGGSGVAGGNGGFSVVGGFYVITGATTTAQLSGDTIANNVSQGGVGGTGGTGAEGGIGGDVFTGGLAIDNEGLTPAVLSSVTISNNLVLGGAGGVGGAGAAGGFGGDAHGGGAYLFNGSTSATPVVYQGNTFSGNIAIGGAGGAGASGGGGGAASGGGAYFDVEGDSSSKSQSETFSGNTALGGIGGAGAAGGSDGTGGIASGGGVYISNITTSVVSLTQDTITGNQALGASGASTSGGNAAFGGGVVANGSGPIQINNTTVTGNSAVGGAGDAGVTGVDGDDGTAGDGDDGGSGNAGGIYLYSSGATAPTLTADTINSNVALGGVGGAGASGGSGGAGGNAFGGGLLISEGSGAANVSDTLIASNTATGGAGGAAGNGGTGGTGGGAAGGGFLSSSTGTELLNSTLYGNTVTGGGGFNAGSAYGGGIEDETGYNALTGMSVVNVTIASNVAQAGKANGGAAGTAYGGGFDNNFGEDLALVVDNTLVANNKAETSASTEIEANGPDFYGQATTALNNLINDASGITTGFTGNGNQLGPSVTVVPGITGAPANNGGPTATLALAANSTARGTGSVTAANAFNLTTDQRGAGFSRIVSGAVDIGAFETQSIVVTPSGTTNTFTVGGAAVAVDAGVTVTFSGADLTGATVTISTGTLQTGDTLHFTTQNGITGVFASGVLTLSGTATPAQYQTALRSVTFSTTSTNITTRSISIVAVDNSLSSGPASESVKVALATPAAPVVTPSGTTNTFTVGGTAVAVDAGVTVTFSGADLTGATVTISTGTLQTGDTLHFTTQNGITGVFASGVLTLSGTATPAQYQAALQSVTFSTTSTSTTTRAISIVATDNSLSSTAAAESVKVALATPAAPVVTPSGTTNTFTVGGAAVAVDAGVTVTFSGADLTGATVTISTGTLQTGDTLHFTNQNGITGVFASGVLTLSGTATPAQYQAALQSVTFSTTSTSTTTRAISIVAADNSLSSTAAAESVKVAPAVTLVGPSVTNAVTTENTQTTSGLVIKPGTGDSAATYFQITAITGGTLYQNNGTTAISSGSFITLAQGAAGLKFTPTTGSLTTGSFQVQESTSSSTAGLGGAIVTATITVSSSASGQPVSLVGAYNLTGITIDGTKFTGGLDGGGHAISETLIGTSQTWNGVKFNIAAAGTPDVVQASGQTLSLPTGSYAKLELLATGVNGNQVNQTFTVHYTDGTSTTFTQSLSDWHTPQSYSGQSVVLSMSYRNTSTGAKDTAGPFDVYGYTLTLNSAKTVQSITLPNNHNVAVLAMTVVAAVPVAAPTNLKATVVSSKEADLSWTAAAGTITGYNVYRGTTSGGESSTPLNSSPLPAGTTSYHDTTVVAGNTYYYVVKAIDGSATSASSNEVVAKITSGAISSTPVSLTGAYSLTGITVDGAKFSGGLDGGGHALSESLVGPSQTWNGVQFNIAPAGAPNVIQSSGQTFILPEGSYSKLELLATGVNGNQANQTFTVRYTDGTTTTFTQSLSDWHTPQNYAGESVVLSNSYRNTSTGTKDTSGPFDVYGYAFTLNPAKTVVAITLPNDHNVAVLAMSLVH
ncbi:MAG TPA: choice-of-anchor Q domain-containing protein, partial [Pirellulales bacterium]|nr:choice-of-anchor Q domain-containing protein [Pirellulales bacterium]